MKRFHVSLFALLCGVVLFAWGASAESDAKAKTQQLVAAFKAVHPATEGALSADKLRHNTLQFKRIDALLHRDSIVGEPIAPHQAKLSSKELDEFKKLFWDTLRVVAYPSSGEFFQKAQYEIEAPKKRSEMVDVNIHAELTEDDIETDITFHWRKIGGKLKLVDVSFDGASLILDYKNQFGRIIAKKGPDGLLNALRKKHEQANETRVTNE